MHATIRSEFLKHSRVKLAESKETVTTHEGEDPDSHVEKLLFDQSHTLLHAARVMSGNLPLRTWLLIKHPLSQVCQTHLWLLQMEAFIWVWIVGTRSFQPSLCVTVTTDWMLSTTLQFNNTRWLSSLLHNCDTVYSAIRLFSGANLEAALPQVWQYREDLFFRSLFSWDKQIGCSLFLSALHFLLLYQSRKMWLFSSFMESFPLTDSFWLQTLRTVVNLMPFIQ